MSIHKLLFLVTFLFCSACSSDLFLDHNGNMPDQEKIAQVHVGQTKEQVLDILGGPSVVTGLSDDHWIYMSSTIKKVAFLNQDKSDRDDLALTFDNGKVSKIETRTLADGNKISIDTDSTKPAERQQGFFRKYFGGVGTYMPFGSNSEKDM